MRLRIRTADPPGTIRGNGMFLRVEDADTGELLEGVQAVRWELKEPCGIASAVVTLIDVDVDLEVDPKHMRVQKQGQWVLGESRLGMSAKRVLPPA